MPYIVKLANASAPSGVAFIGPGLSDGFKTDSIAHAHQFDDAWEAERFAEHFRLQWRGFARFSADDITVEPLKTRSR